MFQFNKCPFIWLLMPTLLGMLFAYHNVNVINSYYSFSTLILFLAALLVLTAVILRLVRFTNRSFGLVLVIFLFLFGIFLISSKEAHVNIQTKNLIHYSAIKYIGHIDDIQKLKSGKLKCEVTTLKYKNGQKWIDWEDKILVFLPKKNHLRRGGFFIFYSKILDFDYFNNPGEFDSKFYWKYKNVNAISFVENSNFNQIHQDPEFSFSENFLQMRDYFATNLSFFLNGQELELAQALLLGDRAGLDKDVTEAFGRTGAMHILAVSGLHIGILMQILMFGFSFFPRLISKKKALILVMIIAWFYALLSGFSASVIRSVVMFSMLILGNLLSKKVHSINILAFSAFVMLCWNPYFLFDLGFQLSYAAMLGIFLFYPFLKQQFYSRFKIIRMVYEGTAIGITAQVFTLPLTLYYFHQFPNYFWLTNIALMAFSFVVLALGVILFILFFSVFLQNIIGYVLEKVMTLMLWIVDSIDKLPLAVAYGFELTKIQVLGLYLLILLFYYVLLKRNVLCLKVVLSVCLVMTGVLVLKRSENINDSFVMFFGGNIPFVVVRENDHNVFVVKSKSGFSNKYIVLSKGFEKIFPGNNKYLNMFNRQNACLEINGKTFLVKSIKGGFEINDTQAMYKILHENDADSTDKSTLHYPLKSPIYLDNNIMIKK